MSPVPQPLALYLDAAAHQVFGLFHDAARTAATPSTGVVLLPQFGWEAMCSHRPRRTWAERLAAAGIPTLRIEYPGAGDSSGSPRDPGLLDAWIASVDAAARWLRSAGGCGRVAVVGLELGGLLACQAVAGGAPVEELVLWNVPANGRTLVRGLRAFARFEAPPPPPPELGPGFDVPDGALLAGGYLLSAQTRADLEALDLTATAQHLPEGLRVLLLGRDELPTDATLDAALRDAGAQVLTVPGPGYSAMTAEPTECIAPTATIEAVTAWLREGSAGAAPGHAPTAPATAATLALPGARETPITIEQPFGRIFGILAEPDGERADVCVVLLNAGALTHVGPNRMWVEAARRWAAGGVPSLRLDVEGIGDADGDATRYVDVGAFYTEELVPQVRAALDELVARGLPPRFILAGLCSGAYWAFHAALDDPRVVGAYLVNPRALLWDEQVRLLQDVRKLRKLARPSMWRKLLDRERSTTPPRVVARAALDLTAERIRARLTGGTPPAAPGYDGCFDALERGTARALFLFTGDEPLYDELTRAGYLDRMSGWPSIELRLVADTPEVHTLRPAWCQRRVHTLLDEALAHDLRT